MGRNFKLYVLLISGILSTIYFFGPVFADTKLLGKYFSWVFDTDIFLLSGGVYGGTSLYLTGTVWPYVIQSLLFLIGWLVLYKLLKWSYMAYRESRNKKRSAE